MVETPSGVSGSRCAKEPCTDIKDVKHLYTNLRYTAWINASDVAAMVHGYEWVDGAKSCDDADLIALVGVAHRMTKMTSLPFEWSRISDACCLFSRHFKLTPRYVLVPVSIVVDALAYTQVLCIDSM